MRALFVLATLFTLQSFAEPDAVSSGVYFKHEIPARGHFNNATDLFNVRDFINAIDGYRECAKDPNGKRYKSSAFFNIGIMDDFIGDEQAADRAYIDSLLAEATPAANVKLGLLRARQGSLEEALSLFDAALALEEDYVFAIRNKIVALSKMDRKDEAKALFEELSDREPQHVEERIVKFDVLMEAGDPAQVGFADRALECDLIVVENGWTDIDLLTCDIMDPERELHDQIMLDPTVVNNWYKLGNFYRDIDMVWRVVRVLHTAIRLDGTFAPAMAIMGAALNDAKFYIESVRPLERGLDLHTGDLWAQANLVMSLAWTCQWPKLNYRMSEFSRQMKIAVEGDVVSFPAPAHMLLIFHKTLELNVYRSWVDKWSKEKSERTSRSFYNMYPPLPPDRRLRLGYVSGAGFQKSPGSSAIRGIFGFHDRSRFHIQCYALKADRHAGELRANISGMCDSFYEMGHVKNDEVLAKMVNEKQSHMLIDVTGYSGDHRMNFLAHKPCPTAVTWLEYPGTLGAYVGLDGIVTDRVASPPEYEIAYAEKLFCVPPPYLPNDYDATVYLPEYGRFPIPEKLPQKFCALHHVWKMDDKMFEIWLDLLKLVPDSVLRLQECAELAKVALRKFAEDRGVDPSRLIFNPKMGDYYEHIGRLSECSIFLDAANYNAHTSAADSLWAGTPVITIPYELMISRGAATLLVSLGLGDCIARTVEDYRDLVMRIGANKKNLESVRKVLRENRYKENMFDTKRWTCAFERGSRILWETRLENDDMFGKTKFHMIPTDEGCPRFQKPT